MFKGTFTAIVTPFTADNQVDHDKLRELVNFQIEGGVDGIVPCGTTGESPTLSMAEHEAVIKTVVDAVGGKAKVVAGTGSNNTTESIHLTQKAAEFGADGALVIMPYYNKPMPSGVYQHFKAVCESGGLPVVVYNIPGRTGKLITAPELVRMYEEIEQIVAIKDAVGDIEYTSTIRSMCDISILSGDDSLTFPMMAVGGQGVISVASNVAPDRVCAMVNLAAKGDFEGARKLHYELWPLFKGLFMETNPIPVKTALEMMGRIPGDLRLPMSALEEANRGKLKALLEQSGLL